MSKTLSSILQKGVISVARGGTGTTTSTGTGSVVLSTSPAISTSLTTPSASFNLINTNATTVNFAGAATSIVIGAALPGLTKINHDLQVEGNIFFNGTANQLSATNLSVNDALIYLAANNTADLLDIGLIGRYNNGVDDDTHAGLVRDATDSVWKLFSNVLDEPTTTVDFSNATYDTLQIGNLLTSKVNKVTITAPSTSATLTLANSSSLITTGNSLTLTTTADTNVTFPTTGTLVNSAVTTLSSLSSVGTITSGIWSSAITTSVDASIHTLTVGLGNSNVASNTIVGYQGLAAIITGAENTAVGYQSLKVTTVGADNTAIGYQTLLANVTGSNNVAVGGYALFNSTNNDNVAIGFQSLKSTTIGAGNTALGYYAGYANSANANTTGSNNIYVGYNTVGSSATNSNEIVIGATAVGLGSNTTVIGNSSTTSSKIFGTLTAANGLIVNTTLTVPSGDTLSRPSAVAGNLRFNTTTASFEGYNGSAWGSIGSGSGGSSGLTPTPIKIEDGYTASANDLVRCNTTAGSFSVLLPASPNDGDMIGFMDVAETFDIHYVSVLPNGKTIENDGTAMLLNIRGTYIVFGYIQITGNWKMLDMQAVVSAAPMASTSVLGIVKVDGTTITINGSGVISGANTYSLTAATTSALGGVIIPAVGTSGLSNSSGTIGLATASTTQLGGVKVDGSTITINGSGVISSAGGGLSPTAIQTANGYVAEANDLVRCNTTSGAFSITLPSAPVDGDIIGVIDTHRKFALNNLTILAAGSKTIEDDTSLVLDIDGSYIALVYNDVNNNWRVLETPLGTGTSSTTIITSNGYIASINDLVRCDTTAAAFSVTLPTSPNDGSIVNFVDVASAGSFFAHNLTVLPGSGNTVQNSSSLILNTNGAYVSLVYNHNTSNWKVLQSSLPTASTTVLGAVKVDGSTITINGSGVISSAGGGLSPTAIQTANGYVAKANDLVRCNTTSGSFSITLPSAPVDGDIIGVIDTHRKFALNNLIILAAGSKTIEDDTTSLVLDINGSYIALVYNDVNSNWRILETPTGTGIISTAIKTSNGYIASVNDLVRCDTTAAAFSVTLPTSPTDGSIVNFVDVASAGSFFTNNLTVLPGSGNTVQNSSSLILNTNGTYVSLVYNQSSTNWKVLQGSQGSLPTASTTQLGGVKVDGSTITINGSGVISSVNNMTYIDCGSAASTYGGLGLSSINAGGAA